MIKGPGIRPGYLPDASVLDIAPTILNIFDLPVGKNMDGKVLHQVLKLNRKIKYNVYTLKKKLKRKKSKADEEAMKELESLGYIQRK
jgi:arylsulfatase A-like enzyme